jgi:hypothetical protein
MKKIDKKDLKFIIVFIVVLACSFTYLYQSSYAKYRKRVTADVGLTVAKWTIKINNEDIKNNKQLTNKLIPEFEESEYTKANVLAPGSKGYCDIVIDSTNVDVNFQITLIAKIPTESAIKDLRVTDYIINPSDTNTDKIAYTELDQIQIPVVHNTPQTSIRLFIEWDDNPTTQTMDNEADTNAAVDTSSEALIEINTNFTQVNN